MMWPLWPGVLQDLIIQLLIPKINQYVDEDHETHITSSAWTLALELTLTDEDLLWLRDSSRLILSFVLSPDTFCFLWCLTLIYAWILLICVHFAVPGYRSRLFCRGFVVCSILLWYCKVLYSIVVYFALVGLGWLKVNNVGDSTWWQCAVSSCIKQIYWRIYGILLLQGRFCWLQSYPVVIK